MSFDEASALLNANLCVKWERKGLQADPVDLMIAAITHTAEASLATRSIRDFEHRRVKLINPWQDRV